MKVKQGYILRKVAGTYVVLPLGQATIEFNGMLTLNESGAMMWELLQAGTTIETLAQKLITEYNISYEHALEDVKEFIGNLENVGCLDM